MKSPFIHIALLLASLTAACGPSPEQQATMTAAAWTRTFTPSVTNTFTPSSTSTPSNTPTDTPTLTPSFTPTHTLTPTFDYPKATVIVNQGACMYGPSSEYLWHRLVLLGDTGLVWGRAPVGRWLWVYFANQDVACWVGPIVVKVEGDLNRVAIVPFERIYDQIPINHLYQPPTGLAAVREGDQVTVSWDRVWMTEDDDRGYFLHVWVCQNGNYIWVPVGRNLLPDQFHTSYTITDQAGCSQPSGGYMYAVEKHGNVRPALTIPWPPATP